MISIIMLTYNRYGYLKRSVESVLAQSDCEFELILINNGSTDASDALCRSYAEKDRRIRYRLIEKSSIAVGRNVGLEMASGNFVAFVDDDDYMERDMFAYLLTLMKESNADIAVCGCWYDFDGAIEPFYVFDDISVMDREQGVDEFLKRERYNSANPCKLFKRHLFENIRYKEDSRYDDIHTLYKLFAEAERVVSSGHPKYFFTRHKGNNSDFALTYALTTEQLSEYLEAFRERTSYLSKKLPGIAPRARYSEWSYMISMVDKINTYQIEDCYPFLDILKAELSANMDEFIGSGFILEKEKVWLRQYFGVEVL